jgi:UPF0716 protein FxsA
MVAPAEGREHPVVTSPAPVQRRWLLPALVVAFIAISVAEVWLLTVVGELIGIWWTLAILVGEAVLGAWLMRREGSKAWRALLDAYSSGRMPTGQLADAALILVGGIFLILPGFLTDLLGLVCLLPWTRPLARRLVGFLIARQAAKRGLDIGTIRTQYGTGTVIRGETVDAPTQDPTPTSPDDNQIIRGEIEE